MVSSYPSGSQGPLQPPKSDHFQRSSSNQSKGRHSTGCGNEARRRRQNFHQSVHRLQLSSVHSLRALGKATGACVGLTRRIRVRAKSGVPAAALCGTSIVLSAAAALDRRWSAAEVSEGKKEQPGKYTRILIGINAGVFVLNLLSKGSILAWGAKVNRSIAAGEWWRYITPAFLHADIIHLLVNSYSLNNLGPLVEQQCGRDRFLAVYGAGALGGAYASYRMCPHPSVGASGAILGLAGGTLVYCERHRDILGKRGQLLQQRIQQVFVLTFLLGLVNSRLDNWGHAGGALGGAAAAWLLGPNYVQTKKGKLVDQPPLDRLLGKTSGTQSDGKLRL